MGADRHILSRGSVIGIRPMLSSGADRVVFDRLTPFSGGEGQVVWAAVPGGVQVEFAVTWTQ